MPVRVDYSGIDLFETVLKTRKRWDVYRQRRAGSLKRTPVVDGIVLLFF